MAKYSDLTLNSGDYVQQYVGSPISEIQQTGNVLAQRHYQNIADMSALELALKHMQAQAPEGARPYIEQQVGQVSQELQNMAKNGAENSTAKVAALNNAFRGDQGLLRVGIQADRIRQLEKNIQDIKQKGGNPLYAQQELENLRKASVYTQDQEGNFTMSPEYSRDLDTHAEIEADRVADYHRITSELQADLKEYGNYVTVDNGRLVFTENAVKELGEDKINQLESRLRQAYRQTESYRQGLKYRGEDDKKATDEIVSYAGLKKFREERTRIQPITDGKGDGDGKGTDKDLSDDIYFATPGAQKLNSESLTQLEQGIEDLRTSLKNAKTPEEAANIQSVIDVENAKLAPLRTEIDKGFDFGKRFKELEDVIKTATTDDYPKDLPTTQEEFENWVRSGGKDERLLLQGGFDKAKKAKAIGILNAASADYKNRIKTVENKLTPVGQYDIPNTNQKDIANFIKDVGSTANITGWKTLGAGSSQLNEQYIKDKNPDYADDSEKQRASGKDQFIPTYTTINGEFVLHHVPAYKHKGGDASQVEYGAGTMVTPTNQTEMRNKIYKLGQELENRGQTAAGIKYQAAAVLSQSFDPLHIDRRQDDITYGIPTNSGEKLKFIIRPVGKVGDANRYYNLLLPDGTQIQGLRNAADLKANIYHYQRESK